MNKINSDLESIVKNNGGTGRDWKEMIKLINSNADEAKSFCAEFKQILRDTTPNQKLIALDLLDFLVTEGNLPLHNQVNTKDFITFLLTMLKNKDSPDVQFKILSLIKKWGLRFENKKDILPNFYETYNTLKINKVVFPEKIESTYFHYLADQNDDFNVDSMYPKFSNIKLEENIPIKTSDVKNNSGRGINIDRNKISQPVFNDFSTGIQGKNNNIRNFENNYGDICLDLEPEKYPKKYKKFLNELITLLNSISISNEMIENADNKKPVDEALREMVSQLKEFDKNLQMAISNQIDDEKLMAISLGINEDMIKLFKRYDDVKAKRKPEAFISSFHTDYAEYNLNNLKQNQQVGGDISSNQDLLNFNFNNTNSNVVGNPGSNLNLINFGSNLANDNGNNYIPHNNLNNQGNNNDVGDIFDILNQMNK